MSRAVIGAGGKPSGWDRRIEGRYSPSSQLHCRVGMKVKGKLQQYGDSKAEQSANGSDRQSWGGAFMYLSLSRTGPAFAHAGMAYPGTSLACSRDHLHPQNLNASHLAFTRPTQTASHAHLPRYSLGVHSRALNYLSPISRGVPPAILCEVPLCDVHKTQPLASQRLSMHTSVWRLSQARCWNRQHVGRMVYGVRVHTNG